MANPYAEDNDPYDYDYQPFGGDDTKQEGNSSGLNEEALRLKAQELQEREESLARREQQIATSSNAPSGGGSGSGDTGTASEHKNWPKCYPILHHSIGDVQPMCKRYARLAYIGWMIFTGLLVLNFICSLITVPINPNSDSNNLSNLAKAKLVILSFLFIVFGVPMNFFLSYWPVYRAAVVNNVARYGIAFVGYSLMMLFTLFLVSGYYDIGSCGLIVAINYFPGDGALVPFLANLIFCILALLMFVYEVVILIMMIRVFRTRKGTFREAGEDFKNQAVRSASSTMVREGMNSASASI
eukprot:gb/GECH01012101.1/.p1 GENE.gb/GECH01012101.1/~~gb/GECH01012101.1/.p1  ORF type:complete len:298 (+),score=51.21 gb/GECH01012101.1/:1-894(+)